MTGSAVQPRTGVCVMKDQVYSEVGDVPRLADVYMPDEAGPHPAIIYLHGGGWRFGDRSLGPDLSRFFAERGFVMVSIDYRLSDEALFPAAVEDTKTAIRWLRVHAKEYNVDPERIGLWGSSSGGHLAALVGLAPEEAFVSQEWPDMNCSVQAVATGYAPINFLLIDAHINPDAVAGTDPESVKIPNPKPSADAHSLESLFLGAPIGEVPQLVELANPAAYAAGVRCPFLIMHGTFDELIPVHQSELLFDAISAAGGMCTFMTIEGLGHGFLNRTNLDENGPRPATVRRTGATPQIETAMIFDATYTFFASNLAEQEIKH